MSSFGWYFWNLVNEQLGLVMAVAFLVGVVVAVVRSVRSRFSTDSLLPELLAGAVFAYLAITYLTHKDPRYSLPGLVYIGVLGTFWLPSIGRRAWRVTALAAVMGFAAINVIGMSTGLGGTHRLAISLPNARNDAMIYTRQLAIYQNQGWLQGGPEHDGNVPALLKGLAATGVNQISADGYTANAPDFNQAGISPYASQVGIQTFSTPNPSINGVLLVLHVPKPGDPPPSAACGPAPASTPFGAHGPASTCSRYATPQTPGSSTRSSARAGRSSSGPR